MNPNRFEKLFSVKKPIIGMIHLAGENRAKKVERALEELTIYEEEGISGAIIEDYHGNTRDVYETLEQSSKINLRIIRGANVLRDPYSSFELANTFNARFVQFDSVQTKDLWLSRYNELKSKYPNVLVFGGVGFKYIDPTGNPLETDLNEAKSRCDAIVTTGEGTGIETPIEKLTEYKKILKDFPLIVGAGVNANNIQEQLKIADGAIIGSYFKPNKNTYLPIDRKKVKDLMKVVKDLRKD